LRLLPKETEKVWEFLKSEPALAGFVLIGGSALALILRHRISEDLDLVYVGEKLARGRMEVVVKNARFQGIELEARDDPAAMEEFEGGSLDLRDYQQDYLANEKVRVSFFVASDGLDRILKPGGEDPPRIATLPELFKSKCLVSAQRSKTRDWLDLYLLLRDHGFTMGDFREAFREARLGSQMDIALSRLCSGVPQKNDEGYSHLLKDAPSLETMRHFFIERRNEFEIQRATQTARSRR
jgi:hypothetical protein